MTYLSRSKFDPMTLPALLSELDRRQADVLHMHGYGATTFGRLAAARRKLPAILHEHANLTDTPWFQKAADVWLARYTDIAIAVSRSTAAFVTGPRLIPADRTHVVYLGVPLEEFSRGRSVDEIRNARALLNIPDGVFAIGTVTRLMPSKGNEYLVAAAADVVREHADPPASTSRAKAICRRQLEAQAAALGLGDRLVFLGFQRDVACRALGARPGRVSIALGGHAADRVRSAGDGKADRRHGCRRPGAIFSPTASTRASCRGATRRRWRRHRRSGSRPRRAIGARLECAA